MNIAVPPELLDALTGLGCAGIFSVLVAWLCCEIGFADEPASR